MIIDAILKIPPGDLLPYAGNARTHSEEQVDNIVASIREFGFLNPVLIDDGNRIVAGHARVMAALKIGLPSVPCLPVRGLTESQIRAYVIADNKLAENAGWNMDLLRLELSALKAVEFDLGVLGFDEADLSALLADQGTNGLTDPDAVPDPPEVPISRLGDVWELGRHRLACGDSTSKEAVTRLLAGATPHLMVTDPPYGVEYDASWRMGLKGGEKGNAAIGKVLNDDRADWRDAWRHFPGDVAYVWHAGSHAKEVHESLVACGFVVYAEIVWAKSQMVISRGHYHSQHEPCLYAVRKGRHGHWQGDRKQKTVWRLLSDVLRPDELCFVRADSPDLVHAISGDASTVWEIPKPQKSETGHSTQKPVECMARPMRNNSRLGESVYEPFSGSGTTIIAAEQTGRTCYAMELSPAYVDVAVKRWENFTGKKGLLIRQ